VPIAVADVTMSPVLLKDRHLTSLLKRGPLHRPRSRARSGDGDDRTRGRCPDADTPPNPGQILPISKKYCGHCSRIHIHVTNCEGGRGNRLVTSPHCARTLASLPQGLVCSRRGERDAVPFDDGEGSTW